MITFTNYLGFVCLTESVFVKNASSVFKRNIADMMKFILIITPGIISIIEFILPNFGNFLISHLASIIKTSKTKIFRAAEAGLWLPPTGLGKAILDWLGKVRLV